MTGETGIIRTEEDCIRKWKGPKLMKGIERPCQAWAEPEATSEGALPGGDPNASPTFHAIKIERCKLGTRKNSSVFLQRGGWPSLGWGPWCTCAGRLPLLIITFPM